jgi:hypothetical protein
MRVLEKIPWWAVLTPLTSWRGAPMLLNFYFQNQGPTMTTPFCIKSVIGLALAASLATLMGCASVEKMTSSATSAIRGDEKLSGAQEVPPVTTAATGTANIQVAADGAVSGSVTTAGVMSTMAHIHMAPADQNGPVIVPLTKNGDNGYTVPAGAKLTPAQLAAYNMGSLYMNVHSAAHKGGEIRAQLKP